LSPAEDVSARPIQEKLCGKRQAAFRTSRFGLDPVNVWSDVFQDLRFVTHSCHPETLPSGVGGGNKTLGKKERTTPCPFGYTVETLDYDEQKAPLQPHFHQT
jgi:hypothetical protein